MMDNKFKLFSHICELQNYIFKAVNHIFKLSFPVIKLQSYMF